MRHHYLSLFFIHNHTICHYYSNTILDYHYQSYIITLFVIIIQILSWIIIINHTLSHYLSLSVKHYHRLSLSLIHYHNLSLFFINYLWYMLRLSTDNSKTDCAVHQKCSSSNASISSWSDRSASFNWVLEGEAILLKLSCWNCLG